MSPKRNEVPYCGGLSQTDMQPWVDLIFRMVTSIQGWIPANKLGLKRGWGGGKGLKAKILKNL